MTKKTGNFFSKKPNKNNVETVEESMNQEEKQETGTIAPETENLSESQAQQTDEIAGESDNSAELQGKNKEDEYQAQIKDAQDKYIRLMAEFDNFRKRTLKERMELLKSAGDDLLVNLLPVKDDFERGLQVMTDASDLESVKQGVQLIYNKFSEFLTQRGVKEIEAVNQDFNVDLHEAITKIPAPEEKLKGKVVDVIQKGYTLNDKVIRYAKVVIGE